MYTVKFIIIYGLMLLVTIITVIGALLAIALPCWLSLENPPVMAEHLPISRAIIATICMICGLLSFTPIHHHIEDLAPIIGVPLIFVCYGICLYYFLGF